MAAEALRVAESDPQRALDLAQQVDDWPSRAERSLAVRGRAAWARGRALRHLGRRRQAGSALVAAVALLDKAGERVAMARASVSLAMEHIDAGRFDEAVALLDAAAGDLRGPLRPALPPSGLWPSSGQAGSSTPRRTGTGP